MLTQAAAKAATAQARAYKIFDGGGLHLHVARTGRKTWRLKYRFDGREKLLTIGAYPSVSLAEARGVRETCKAALREGRDPSKESHSFDTFERLARAWYQHNLASWSEAHAADVIGSLERDVFPAIGAKSADAIAPKELLALLRLVERRGQVVTAHRIRQRLSEIFAYGIAEGLVDDDRDPAAKLGAAMREPPPATPQAALTSIEDCRALLVACDRADARPITVLASRFLALTAVRLAAVRHMRWSEIHDLDGPAPIWRVPAAHMKLKKAKKGEARFDHVVPLSAAAVDVLRAAAREIGYDTHSLTIAGERQNSLSLAPGPSVVDNKNLVFPGRDGNTPIGESTIGELYDRVGFTGRHVPHGWRSSFSTILNEDLGEEWAVTIDRALAHAGKDKVEAAYNRAQQLARRRRVFDRWAQLLAGG